MSKVKKKDYIDEAFHDVPEPGAVLTRWYDVPYKILTFLNKGTKSKLVPRPVRSSIRRALHNIRQLNEFDRMKGWNKEDSMHNLIVPDNEHVTVSSIYAIELFTPNEAASLDKIFRRNKWNKRRYERDSTNSERLAESRSRSGLSWWKLPAVTDGKSGYYIPDAMIGHTPDDFRWIQSKAIQVGSGMTAIVTQFSLKEDKRAKLDDLWHAEYEPSLSKNGNGLHPIDRQFTAYKRIQQARNQLHDEAREWMRTNYPGYFASHDEKVVIVDFLLTDQYDPTSRSKKPPTPDVRDAFRALGINVTDYYRTVASNMKYFVFTQADYLAKPYIPSDRTWSLVGKKSKVDKALGKYFSSIESIIDERIGYILILLSASELLSIIESQYSRLRDNAGLQHKKFKVTSINNLNRSVLDSALTLASVRHDIESVLKNKWWLRDAADFKSTVAPFFTKRPKDTPIDFIEDTLKRHKATLKRLKDIDRDYRDILTTVSSLGSTANNIKLGRLALIIAFVSMAVAVVTLFATVAMNSSSQDTAKTKEASVLSQDTQAS